MAEEVVRRLTIQGSAPGTDQAAASVKNLADQTNNLAQVVDISAKRALSAEGEYKKLVYQIDGGARAAVKMADGTETLNRALEQGVITQDEYNRNLELLKEKYSTVDAANDNVAGGFHSTGLEVASATNHIKTAAVAAYALSPAFRAMVDPAIKAGITATGSALSFLAPYLGAATMEILGRLLPAFNSLLRIAGPIGAVVSSIQLIQFAWSSAGDEIKKHNDIAKNAYEQGVTVDFFQRIEKAAEKAGGKIGDATELLKRFNAASQNKLGGSDVSNQLDKHIQVGNLDRNIGLDDIIGSEAKLRALSGVLTEMVEDGKKLAALDIASKFMNAEQLEMFRQNDNYLKDMVESADKLASKNLIEQAEIDKAVALQSRYDAAVRILSERWIPFQDTITAGGMKLQSIWVSIVEAIASAANAVGDVATKISQLEPPAWLKNAGTAALRATVGLIPGGAVATAAYDYASQPGPSDERSDAQRALARGLSNKYNVKTAMSDATGSYSRVFKDTSKALEDTTDDTEEYADAVDRAIQSLNKHIEMQKAEAAAVGASAGEHARLRAEAAQLAAVQANGGKITAEQTQRFKQLQFAAGDAAEALERAKIGNAIDRGRRTALLSSEDVAIADRLAGIYKNDITAALASSEAAALRTNNALREVGDVFNQGFNSAVPAIRDAINGTNDFGTSIRNVSATAVKALQDIIIKLMIIKPLMNGLTGAFGGGGGDITLGGPAGPVPFYADGVDFAPGGMAIVGERGPELVNLPRGSSVIPNNKTMQALGGAMSLMFAPVYNVTGSGPEIAALKAQMARDRAEFEAKTIAVVRKAEKSRKFAA